MFKLEYKRQLLHTHSDWKTKYGKCYNKSTVLVVYFTFCINIDAEQI
jgi:hypothetical protein